MNERGENDDVAKMKNQPKTLLFTFPQNKKFNIEHEKLTLPTWAKTLSQKIPSIANSGKSEPFTEHTPFNQYLEILFKIDVAISNHRRLQEFGNTITFLGLGK